MLSLAAGNARVYHNEITAHVGTDFDGAFLIVVVMLVRMVLVVSAFTIHTNASDTVAIGALDDNNANVVPSRE